MIASIVLVLDDLAGFTWFKEAFSSAQSGHYGSRW